MRRSSQSSANRVSSVLIVLAPADCDVDQRQVGARRLVDRLAGGVGGEAHGRPNQGRHDGGHDGCKASSHDGRQTTMRTRMDAPQTDSLAAAGAELALPYLEGTEEFAAFAARARDGIARARV